MTWTPATIGLPDLTPAQTARLSALPVLSVPANAALFRAGDRASGYVIVLSGRVDVVLTGPTGREILLYAVEPGQSCIQTTLGLLGDEPYGGEAITATASKLVMIPAALFHDLLDTSAAFRAFVFRAFALRMTDMTALLERVAFTKVETRLAAALLDLAEGAIVTATHADLAGRIGSAREVVSRRLDAMARKGLVTTDRGQITLTNLPALRQIAQTPV